ncbi:MAG: hypothetical protein Q3971_03245 [Moraxella sp.]|nr:hypothetical protein [Moraxella sp.]
MNNPNEFKAVFKGCVVLPLTDDDADIERIRYYGDWANKRTHARIMKKPRRYQLTFYFKGHEGERGSQTIQILHKDNFMELSAYIKAFGDEALREIGAGRVDLKKSYVSIRA